MLRAGEDRQGDHCEHETEDEEDRGQSRSRHEPRGCQHGKRGLIAARYRPEQHPDDHRRNFTTGFRYVDRFARRPVGAGGDPQWRIAERVCTTEWVQIDSPDSPRDAQPTLPVVFQLMCYQVTVPVGTVSQNEAFWKRIDENALDVTTLNVAAHRLQSLIHDRRILLSAHGHEQALGQPVDRT